MGILRSLIRYVYNSMQVNGLLRFHLPKPLFIAQSLFLTHSVLETHHTADIRRKHITQGAPPKHEVMFQSGAYGIARRK